MNLTDFDAVRIGEYTTYRTANGWTVKTYDPLNDRDLYYRNAKWYTDYAKAQQFANISRAIEIIRGLKNE